MQFLFESGLLATSATPAKKFTNLREILDVFLEAENGLTLSESVRMNKISGRWNAIPGFRDLHSQIQQEI